MKGQEVYEGQLEKVGAVLKGHFVGTSRRHLDTYIDKDAIYPHVLLVAELCSDLVKRFTLHNVGVEYDMVVAPEKGGIILSQWTAYNSAHVRRAGLEILAVYAEKKDGGFVFRRGYAKLIPGRKVLVVDDTLRTGGSAGKVVEAVRAFGGNVIGLGAIWNGGGVTAKDVGDVPRLEALINQKLASWDEANCPLCEQGIPINTDVGWGREFLARKQSA